MPPHPSDNYPDSCSAGGVGWAGARCGNLVPRRVFVSFFLLFLLLLYLLFLIEDVISLKNCGDDPVLGSSDLAISSVGILVVCFPAGWAEFMRDEETVVRSLCILQISLICYKSTERFSWLYERLAQKKTKPISMRQQRLNRVWIMLKCATSKKFSITILTTDAIQNCYYNIWGMS